MSDEKETPKTEISPEELPKEELDEVVGGVTTGKHIQGGKIHL
jgi:hypothetical protein